MLEWLPLVALAVGAAHYFGRMAWRAWNNARAPVDWKCRLRGVIVAGEPLLSPSRIPCVGYGVVLYKDEEGVTHRGGFTAGFRFRTSEDEIVEVPKGAIEVDGEEFHVGREDPGPVYAYLAEVGLIDEESLGVQVQFDRAVEVRLEIGQRISLLSSDVSGETLATPFRDRPRERQVRGRIRIGPA